MKGFWRPDRLADARVVVMGCGALGNEIIKQLALLGVGELKIIDCDEAAGQLRCEFSFDQILDNPERMESMSPEQFESFVATIYKKLGYNVQLTKKSHDGGVDLLLQKTIDGMSIRLIVQCKHTIDKCKDRRLHCTGIARHVERLRRFRSNISYLDHERTLFQADTSACKTTCRTPFWL